MNSRVQLPIRFSDLVMERTQKSGTEGRTHTILVGCLAVL